MYASRRQRYRATIQLIQQLMRAMALDARAFSGIVVEARPRSSASAPSLRARESEVMALPMGRSTPDLGGGGNVRVVVRVRGFLPRGLCLMGTQWALS